MPAGSKPEMLLKVGAEFDADEVSKGLRRMGTDWGKRMREVEKRSEKSMKGAGGAVSKFLWTFGGAKKAYQKLYTEQRNAYREIIKTNVAAVKALREQEAAVEDLTNKIKAIPKGETSDTFKEMNKQLKEATKRAAELEQLVAETGRKKEETKAARKETKRKTSFDRDEKVGAIQEAGAELWDPFESLLQKDLPGALEKGGKLVGKGWEGIFKGSGKLVKHMGLGLAKYWGEKAEKAKAAGGGGKMAAAGAKVAGVAGKGIGGLLKVVSKLGPILSTVSTLVVGLVKFFLDAESAAKEFNKQVLSTAGSAEFLGANMGNTDAAAQDLEGTLGRIRDAATSLDNMDWGINKETHTAVLNSITAEGVSLKQLDDDFKRVGKSAKDATGYAEDWGSMVQMSVAYSRAFGVSLQEVGQFQGEMLSDLGMNLEQTETSFQYMLRGAEEAGIATNKFFGIIRGFSADLGLFTVRMADVTKMLGLLGKAMSPREAQKMMQSLESMFKGRSLVDLVKDVKMSGPAGRAARVKQQAGEVKELAEGAGLTADEMHDVLRKNNRDLGIWIAKKGKSLSQKQIQAIYEASDTEQKLATGNEIDLAATFKTANLLTAKKIADAKVFKLTNKHLADLHGLDKVAAENAAEVPEELQRQADIFDKSIQETKAALVGKLIDAKGDASKFSKKEQKLFEAIGVNIKDDSTFNKLSSASEEDLYNSMDMTQKESLDESKKLTAYEQKISGLQTSIQDKLAVLVEFMMNQLYGVLTKTMGIIADVLESTGFLKGIYDFIAAIGRKFGIDIQLGEDVRKEFNKNLVAIAETNNKALMAAAKGATSMEGIRKNLQQSPVGQAITKTLKTGQAQQDALNDKLVKAQAKSDAATNSDDKKIADDEIKTTKEQLEELGKKIKAAKEAKAAFESDTSVEKTAELISGFGKNFGKDVEQQSMLLELQKKLAESSSDDEKAALQKQIDTLKSGSPEDAAKLMADKLKEHNPSAEASDQAGLKPHSLYTHDVTAESMADDAIEQDAANGDTLSDIYRALRFRGIRMDKAFLTTIYKKVVTEAVFDAASEALADYYVMMHTDDNEVLEAIQKGSDPKTIAHTMTDAFKSGKGTLSGGAIKGITPEHPNAQGGVISAVRDGMAVVRPSAGEGVLTGRPGERIGGGGGGQVIQIEFKGDAGRLLDARTQNVIARDKSASTKR